MSHAGRTAFSQAKPQYPLTTTWHRLARRSIQQAEAMAPLHPVHCPAPSRCWRMLQPESHTEGGGKCSLAERQQEAPAGAVPWPESHTRGSHPIHQAQGPGSDTTHLPRRGQQDSSQLGTSSPMFQAKRKLWTANVSRAPCFLPARRDLRLDTSSLWASVSASEKRGPGPD